VYKEAPGFHPELVYDDQAVMEPTPDVDVRQYAAVVVEVVAAAPHDEGLTLAH
jgi:hypothetical protein